MSTKRKLKNPLRREIWPKIRQIVLKERVFFQIDCRPVAKRETYASLQDAQTRADQLAEEKDEYGKEGFHAPVKDRILLAELHTIITPYGKSLRDAVDVAKRVWDEDKVREGSVSMGVALDEWLQSKELLYRHGRIRLRTIQNLRPLVKEFRSAFGHLSVITLTPETIKEYEEERPSQSRTLLTKRAKLSELFKFTMLKGWRFDNPIEKLHGLSPLEAKRVAVSILSIKDTRDLLNAHIGVSFGYGVDKMGRKTKWGWILQSA